MARLAAFVHPAKGVRFSPYGYVDTASDLRFTAAEVARLRNDDRARLWGSFDGSGDPMQLTFADYHRRFVYDFDFLRAPKVAVDSAPMGTGNSLDNRRQVYPMASIVEYHSPGVDPQHGEMDWRSLWLVLERVGNEWFLVGVVHGSWTS